MKKMNKKGFTLMEMLIVVAIIAILIAIAIPTFSNQLLKSKQAADNATVRSAYAEAMATYLVSNTAVSKQAFEITSKGSAYVKGGTQAKGNGEVISNSFTAGWAAANYQVVVWVNADGKVALSSGPADNLTGNGTWAVSPAATQYKN